MVYYLSIFLIEKGKTFFIFACSSPHTPSHWVIKSHVAGISLSWFSVFPGWSPEARYSENILEDAHLLHWNGPFKPWNYPAVHLDLWERWFVPDPSKRFSLVRPESDSWSLWCVPCGRHGRIQSVKSRICEQQWKMLWKVRNSNHSSFSDCKFNKSKWVCTNYKMFPIYW